jgi:hypothetical protein
MALIQPTPPERTRVALIAGLGNFIDIDNPLARILIHGQRGQHVFALGLTELLEGNGPGRAHPVGWRFLAGNAAGLAIAADVTNDESPELTSLSRGSENAAAIRAIQEAETIEKVEKNDYELLVLKIPGILVECLWLKWWKSATDKDDLVVPFQTRARQLQTKTVYNRDEFMMIAQPLGETFLTFSPYPKPVPRREESR